MKRRWVFAAAAAALIAAAGAAVWFLGPRPPEAFPLAELVPADALFYAGFPDLDALDRAAARLPREWIDPLRAKLDPSRRWLAGATAVYVDRELEWIFLARLGRAAALAAGVEREGDAAVIARSPAALARWRGRGRSLLEHPDFRPLRSRFFINLENLRLKGRLRDFTALGFDIDPAGRGIVLRGRAACRAGFYRYSLEHYVQAPRRYAPPDGCPAGLAFVEHFPRLWDDLLRELSPADRERVEHEASAIGRDLLGGRGVREFLGRLGPGCRLVAVPTPHGFPALTGLIDFPDAATRDKFGAMLLKAARDAENYAREHAREPFFELRAEGPLWRLRFPGPASARLGDAFTPAYFFWDNRLVFSTCASALDALPVVPPGESHAAMTIFVAESLDLARALSGWRADGAFMDEAERAAALQHLRSWTPGMIEARRRQLLAKHDPKTAEFELAKFLGSEKSRMVAEELGRISKTERYAAELARLRAEVEEWERRLGWLEHVTLEGRFTGEGFEFVLCALLR
jgi:hypothetical protein